MASFSRILKFASLLLPLVAALPTESMAVEPIIKTPGNMTIAEAMTQHVPRDSGCANDNGGVHIMVARGSTEPPGEGSLGALAQLVMNGVPGSDSMGIDYPALLSPYQWSVNQGTNALNQAIADYVQRCPRSRIVLMGYSQGAQVVMNSLCGTNEASFAPTPQIEKKYWKHIAAALVYADPSHLAGKSYDRGTSSLNGIFPRTDSQLCDPFAKRIAAYCDWNDPVCASGSDEQVHFSYFTNYDAKAAPWIIKKAKHHSPWLRHQSKRYQNKHH